MDPTLVATADSSAVPVEALVGGAVTWGLAELVKLAAPKSAEKRKALRKAIPILAPVVGAVATAGLAAATGGLALGPALLQGLVAGVGAVLAHRASRVGRKG